MAKIILRSVETEINEIVYSESVLYFCDRGDEVVAEGKRQRRQRRANESRAECSAPGLE